MRAVIIGCGRVGALLAEMLDRAGHGVTIIDVSTRAFDRLPQSFRGAAIRGDGTDEAVLRRAGVEGADVVISLTEGDNRNVMAAQLARDALGVERVMAKINDPVRAAAYADLGIATICRTTMLADAILGFLGEATSGQPGVRAAQRSSGGQGTAPGSAGQGGVTVNPSAGATGAAVGG